jgi:hypothetical protein
MRSKRRIGEALIVAGLACLVAPQRANARPVNITTDQQATAQKQNVDFDLTYVEELVSWVGFPVSDRRIASSGSLAGIWVYVFVGTTLAFLYAARRTGLPLMRIRSPSRIDRVPSGSGQPADARDAGMARRQSGRKTPPGIAPAAVNLRANHQGYIPEIIVEYERLQDRLHILDERAKRHLRLILAFGLGASVAMAVTIAACVGDSPWSARILAATIATPLGVCARFFQNRYKNDLRGQDQVLEALLRANKGHRRENAKCDARRCGSSAVGSRAGRT